MKAFLIAIGLAVCASPAGAVDYSAVNFPQTYMECVVHFGFNDDMPRLDAICEKEIFAIWQTQPNFQAEFARMKKDSPFMQGYIDGRDRARHQ